MAVFKTLLLFSDVELLAAGLELQADKSAIDCPIYVLDDHWPLNRQANIAQLERLKRRWPQMTVVTAPKNLGIHHGFNYLTSQMPLQEDDLIITTAPDSVPVVGGWDSAMVEALESIPSLAYVGAWSFAIPQTPDRIWQMKAVIRPNGEHVLDVAVPNLPCMLHGTGWKWNFLKGVGGFHEPTNFYGHLEAVMWNRARAVGMHGGYLPDYPEDFRLEAYHPQIYRDYKLAHALAAPGQEFTGNFETWLRMKGHL